MKLMDITEFVEKGYLQEVNRQFFHPLGLALAIKKHDNGKIEWQGIIDSRDDIEGFYFASLAEAMSMERAEHVAKEKAKRAIVRKKRFGWIVQPVGSQVSVEGETDREYTVRDDVAHILALSYLGLSPARIAREVKRDVKHVRRVLARYPEG